MISKTTQGLALLLLATMAVFAQDQSGTEPMVPSFVKYVGVLADANGRPIEGAAEVTFSLYKAPQGGAALWMESQKVQADSSGNYAVILGSTTIEGLPASLFAAGEARWLGVQVPGQAEQPRVMLLAVPYAMKAKDAETLGGLPASAFMLAAPPLIGAPNTASSSAAAASSGSPLTPSGVTTNGGTVNKLPLFSTGTDIENSAVTQTGSGSTARIGIGTTTPSAALDVNGGATIRGLVYLAAKTQATAAAGQNSQPISMSASSYSSSLNAAVHQTFQWLAEPAANNTANPSGTMNLLYGLGSASPTETGVKINSNGIFTFAPGQTFPGNGTITGVTAGTDLTGGGSSGNVTLNLDTTKVPMLQSSNTFAGTEKFAGNVGVGTAPSSTGYTPLTVGGATNFGTWLALANTSAGGHTWNIISAGSGNAEGAGNLGITDLTGTSTIWLEGNTNTTNLTASGTVGAAALVVTNTAGSAIIDADGFGKNAGGPTPGLRFGGGGSGEGIASNRVIGATTFGLDFYTNFTSRMSILQNGQVAVGTTSPGAALGVVSNLPDAVGIYVQAGDAASGSNQAGAIGLQAYGSSADLNSTQSPEGGDGVWAHGGIGSPGGFGGDGGVFIGAPNSTNDSFGGGDGLFAVVGSSATGDFAPQAGRFSGDIFVSGSVNNAVAVLVMDHPQDPSNKLLKHAAVESPEMKNIYDGNVTTDASGEAIVQLPDYFESLNRDFRYQLTVLGQFAQAIVSGKIANHRFTIRTDKPNVEVSWQVTGIRQDAWATAHPLNVESDKTGLYRGHYLHPEVFGAPQEAGIDWARHPQQMKRIREMREQARGRAAAATPNAIAKP